MKFPSAVDSAAVEFHTLPKNVFLPGTLVKNLLPACEGNRYRYVRMYTMPGQGRKNLPLFRVWHNSGIPLGVWVLKIT